MPELTQIADTDTTAVFDNVGASRMFGEATQLSNAISDSLSFSTDQAAAVLDSTSPGMAVDSLSGFTGTLDTALPGAMLADNIVIRLAVLGLFIAYLILVGRYLNHIYAVFNLIRGRSYVEKLLDDQNYSFERFVTISNLIGYLIISISIVKFMDVWGVEILSLTDIPYWISLSGVAIVWFVFVVIRAIQRIALKATGSLILRKRFTDKLIYLRRLTISLLAVVTAPFVLMLALAPADTARTLLIVVLIEYTALFIFFLLRTLVLFVEQKISIFYWILYLCAVEIFPLTVPVALVMRNLG